MATIFAFPGYERLLDNINQPLGFDVGAVMLRRFPDGESLLQIQSETVESEVILVCGLEDADRKLMPLLCFSEVAREMGASNITLVAPYLGYMRQDKRFHPGEAVSAPIFAQFISSHFDSLVTVDPHLHRIRALDEVYRIPNKVVAAAPMLADWVRNHVRNPLLIGPDAESKQWVSEVAGLADTPYVILEKTRHGDEEVTISLPDLTSYHSHTPVLIDDVISSGGTMLEAIRGLRHAGLAKPLCIAVHAMFAKNAYALLQDAGVEKIVSCNTITHVSNQVDVSGLLADGIKTLPCYK